MLWHLEIQPAPGHPDLVGGRLSLEAAEAGLPGSWSIAASRGFLIEGALTPADVDRAARQVLVDPVVESFRVHPQGTSAPAGETVVHVLPKPGVTDPEAESAAELLRDLGFDVVGMRTIRSYRVGGPAEHLPRLIQRVLANDAVEQAVVGALPFDHLGQGHHYEFHLVTSRSAAMDDAGPARHEQVGAALAQPGRDAVDPGPLRRARPRPDRLRARDPGPDLERALLAQDAQGPDRVRGADDRQPAQADDLRRDPGARTSTGSSASSPTMPA